MIKQALKTVFASVSGAASMLTGDGYAQGYESAANAFDYTMTAWGANAKSIAQKVANAAEETFAWTSAAAHMVTGETPQHGYAVAKNATSYAKTRLGAK